MKIIYTIEEVQAYLPVQMTSDINVVAPFINNAERSYLKSVVGTEQFKALVQAYESAGKNVAEIADDEVREAVELAQKIVTTIGYFKAIPILAVKIGTSGIQVFSNTDTKQAFNWQVEDLKEALIDLGYGAIEDLLLLLDSNPDKFEEYINSPEYISTEEFLIESATDFTRYFNINNSRYIFSNISYLMRRIEDQVVKKIFGSEFFNLLKVDNLEGKQLVLANEYIKPGIALLTAAKAIVERVITFDNGVARINLVANYEAAKNSIVASRDQVKDANEQLVTDGNKFLQDGIQFTLDNLADFPDYVAPVSRSNYNVTNNPDGGVFFY